MLCQFLEDRMKFFSQKKCFGSVERIHWRHHQIQSAVCLWCQSQSTPALLINFHTSFSLQNQSLLYNIYSFVSLSIFLSLSLSSLSFFKKAVYGSRSGLLKAFKCGAGTLQLGHIIVTLSIVPKSLPLPFNGNIRTACWLDFTAFKFIISDPASV